MPFLVIAGLMALIIYLASRAPDTGAGESLPSNNQVPFVGATGTPSPATTGASPLNSEIAQTVLQTVSSLPRTGGVRRPSSNLPPGGVVNSSALAVPTTTQEKSLSTDKPMATTPTLVFGDGRPGMFRKL